MERHSKEHSTKLIKRKMTGIGTAHGKIILMGEHSVVYDYPAIAIPIPNIQVVTTTWLTENENSTLDCHYFQGDIELAPSYLANIIKAIELTLETFKLGQPAIHLQINSDIPQERGMGSSAAVTVSVVRAIADLFDISISDYQLHFIVNQAEVIAHQSTSGLDTLMTSTLNPVIYQKSRHPKAFKLDLPGYLIVADSGQVGQTRASVHHVSQLNDRKPKYVKQTMKAIGQFVQQAFESMQAQNLVELGRLMTYNHYYLNQLGVSNSHLDKIVNAAWMAGALGAKLTGGGRGGCLIALSDNQSKAKQIAQAMEEAGAIKTWCLPLTFA